MLHTVSVVKVYVTTDYKKFQRVRGNRVLNQGKIRKMVKDIESGLDFLPDFPIVTSKIETKLEINDGQHRFEAAVQTNKPVYYIIRNTNMKLDEMARVNSLQEKWKPKDFVNCYIEKGVKDYGVLEDFVDQYGLPIKMAAKLLYYGVTGANEGGGNDAFSKLFEHGEFKAKHLKQATEIMEACKRFAKFDAWNSGPFIVAITKILGADKADFDKLVEKFDKNADMLEHQGSAKGYIFNLEQIYNKNSHKREVIY